jgi:short-subunit dehydrogenase
MPKDLRNLPIAITGASSGIGLATALACARAGMPVALGARRLDRLESAVKQIEALGGRALAVSCDVTRPEDCENLITRCEEAFGSIYSVYANAGYGIEAPVMRTTTQQFRDIFETNFYGTLSVLRPAVERMRAQGRGHVLICSSCVSKVGIPHLSAYSATKAAQDHIGRALRIELAGTGIHISTVHPIGTDTEFSDVVTAKSNVQARVTRAPKRFRQSVDVVADATVACLRRPKGEVWTSLSARVLAAFSIIAPGTFDWGLRRRFAPKT